MGERTRELTILILGDVALFFVALWFTLLVRYLELPSLELLSIHFVPFLILSAVWIFIFYIAGLYDKQTLFFKSFLFTRILNTIVVSGIIATLLFLIVPFGIAPKTNLIIFLVFLVAIFTWWRMYAYHYIAPKVRYRAILLADGPEAIELFDEINNNNRYTYSFVRLIDAEAAKKAINFEQKLFGLIEREQIDIIVANPNETYLAGVLPKIFNLTFIDFKLTFIDFYKLYENTFDRIPLSSLSYEWFIAQVSQSRNFFYEITKRGLDIAGSLVLGAVFLLMLPFVYLAIRLEGPGELFIVQERIGQFNRPIKIYKIRTMTENRSASATWAVEDGKQGNVITKVGAVLRKLSIDELPQVWSILKGDMSLIGPRNDIKGLWERCALEIPYYNIRNFVKPGVTGWAQTQQHYSGSNISPQSMEDTKIRLSYDLYYIKNRSIMLDVTVALRTLKTLLSRFGVTIRLPL